LDSKTEEQVRKRRAKASPTPLNIYQKVLLLGGLLTIFLIAGIAPRMASKLPVMIIGAIGVSLSIFFWFRSNKQKREIGKKVDLREAEILPLSEEKSADRQEPAPEAEEKVGILGEVFPGENKAVDFEEKFPEEPEVAGTLQGRFPEEEGKGVDPQDFPAQEKAANIEKMLLRLEEKTGDIQGLLSNLEDRAVQIEETFLKLDEKAAHLEEMLLKPEKKIDMQMILSQDDSFPMGGKI
jgi:hypothetical protein